MKIWHQNLCVSNFYVCVERIAGGKVCYGGSSINLYSLLSSSLLIFSSFTFTAVSLYPKFFCIFFSDDLLTCFYLKLSLTICVYVCVPVCMCTYLMNCPIRLASCFGGPQSAGVTVRVRVLIEIYKKSKYEALETKLFS